MVKIVNSRLKEVEISENLRDKFLRVKAFLFDIDGVMTDGSILVAESGEFLRIYSAKDGFGIRMASMNGFALGIITGGHSDTIAARFTKFGFAADDIYLNAKDKIRDFRDFCARHSLREDEILYCGDDIPDTPVLKCAGVGVCPADAMEEAALYADYVSPFPAGERFIRDVIETVLRIQGKWEFDVGHYDKTY